MDNSTPSREAATTVILRLLVLGLLLIGCFLVLRPFVSALMWSAVFCFSIWPVYSRLVNVLRGRRTLAAAIMTLCTLLVLFTPFVLIGFSLANDVQNFAAGTREFLESPPLDAPGWMQRLPLVGPRIQDTWHKVAADSAYLMTRLRRFVEPATMTLLAASVQFIRGLAELALSIFIAFFLFRDGAVVAQRLVKTAETIAGDQARQLIDVAGRTVRGVVYGILGTALAQGIIAGIGFLIAGVPSAGFLALMTFFLSVLPMGPPLIWIPVSIWLFWKGSVGWGIFMICWGLLVSSVDNVVKPMIISQGSQMPFLFIFLGVLGGAIAFGFIGVFLGPTLLVVGFRLLDYWNSSSLPGSEKPVT